MGLEVQEVGMRRITAAAFAVAMIGMAGTAERADAQFLPVPLSFDVRADAAFPTGDFDNIAGTGLGISVGVSAAVVPGFAVYGNYTQTRFGGGWTGGDDADAIDSGFAIGLSALLPGATQVSPWVGAGLLFHRLEIAGSRQGISENPGFEIGGGIAVPITGQLRLSPAVSYRRYNAEVQALPAPLPPGDLTVQYFTLGVGLNLAL
jgi:opacity protein-like surface antigen